MIEVYKCEDCGYESSDWNYLDVDAATDVDPNPVIKCPKCGGFCDIKHHEI